MHIRPRHQLATEHHDPVKLLRATLITKNRSARNSSAARRSEPSVDCRQSNMPLETDAPQQNHVRHQALKAWPRTVRIGFTSKQRKAILRVSAGKRFSGMQRFRSDRFATGRADHRAAFLFLLVSESHH